VHDVEQVVVVPCSHLMQAAMHCWSTFGLYDGNESVAHLFVWPEASPSGEQEYMTMATTKARLRLRLIIWAARKWIAYYGSMFRFPPVSGCTCRTKTTIKLPVKSARHGETGLGSTFRRAVRNPLVEHWTAD